MQPLKQTNERKKKAGISETITKEQFLKQNALTESGKLYKFQLCCIMSRSVEN